MKKSLMLFMAALLICSILTISETKAQIIVDQYFSLKMCDVTELRELTPETNIVQNDPPNFSLLSGKGSIDSQTGVITYRPETSGVFSFIVVATAELSTDTAMIEDTISLNMPASVTTEDLFVELCAQDTICFEIFGWDEDDDMFDLVMLEGLGELNMNSDTSAEVCFLPADIDSADYMFIFRTEDSCFNVFPPESRSYMKNSTALDYENCCLDTMIVTVIISQPPVLLCPDTIKVRCSDEELCYRVRVQGERPSRSLLLEVLSGNATVRDNRGICLDVSEAGEYEIIVKATDSCENYDICTTYVEVKCAEVHFDIKPTSCPNPLSVKGNNNRRAVIPAALLGTEDFDVRDIDPESIRLEGVSPLRYAYEDVTTPVYEKEDSCECTEEGPDGYEDLTLKFNKADVKDALGDRIEQNEVVLKLIGKLKDGTAFESYDCMVIRPKPNKDDNGDNGGIDSTSAFNGVLSFSNHPNPFNPSTVISFSLEKASHIKLEVFNVKGQRVSLMVDGQMSSGKHSIEWNGSDYASGVYFYRITTDEGKVTKKMILMK